jgi:cytochrome oxidase assembly protein ShyY1
LHLSVTDTRMSVATRPNASTSIHPGYLRCVFSLVRQPRWIALVAVTAGLCLLFWWLGTWQWHRHESRSALNEAVHAAQNEPVEPLTSVVPDPSELPAGTDNRRVSVSGHYLATEQSLQRNPSGRAGYAVITPLDLDSGGTLLVNRGFVPPSLTDPNAPAADVAPPPGPVQLTVRLREPQESGDRTAPDGQIYDIDPATYPQPLLSPVYDAYGDLVEQSPAPAEELELPAAPDLGMGPHLFYAFQWWSFIPIAIVGLLLLLRRESKALDQTEGSDTPPVTQAHQTDPTLPRG